MRGNELGGKIMKAMRIIILCFVEVVLLSCTTTNNYKNEYKIYSDLKVKGSFTETISEQEKNDLKNLMRGFLVADDPAIYTDKILSYGRNSLPLLIKEVYNTNKVKNTPWLYFRSIGGGGEYARGYADYEYTVGEHCYELIYQLIKPHRGQLRPIYDYEYLINWFDNRSTLSLEELREDLKIKYKEISELDD
jgi:hypothetical protein